MKRNEVLKGGIPLALYLLAVLMLASLVSIMISFMWRGQSSANLETLMALQRGGIFASLVAGAGALYVFATAGTGNAIGQLWQHLPNGLIFSWILLNSLAIAGAGSYWLIASALEWVGETVNFTSLVCLSSASSAYLALSALGHFLAGKDPYSHARF